MSPWQIIACSVPYIRRDRSRGGRKVSEKGRASLELIFGLKAPVVLLRKDLFICDDGGGLSHSWILIISSG